MNKFIQWHKSIFYGMLEKWNISSYQAAWLSWTKGLLMGLLLLFLCSCSTYRLSTLNYDPIYGPEEVVLQVPADVKIDTLSYSQLKWKLRTDNTFRWNFAQYAMDQPYNWYANNFRYSYWRPFNSFDVYFNRYDFWYDWAFNYPYYWGYSSWHNPWRHNWFRPYRPWNNWYNGPYNNPGYNAIWNSSRENTNIAFINGRRGSNNINNRVNSNIENNIITRYNNPRRSVPENNLNNIVNGLRERLNVKPRVYTNPNNVPNNNIRIYNRTPNINSNNNLNINTTRPSYNSSSRSSSNISRGSSSSSSSGRSSSGSSRGGRINN